jgi:DNA-3-methyladenine glycosylase II
MIPPMTGRLIGTQADIAEGTAWLAAREPAFAAALAVTGPPPLRLKPPGFAALLEAIVSQQISLAAADGILRRLVAAGATDAAAVARMDEAALVACGLSRPKARHVFALARADPDLDGLARLPDAGVVAELVRLPGIGVWTAEVYAIACLGRADILAAGDLALQEAARLVFGLAARPKERELRAMALSWSPWRAVAARLLWAYYRVAKARGGER